MKNATEFNLNLPDVPGTLNDVCVALSKYDVNIKSIAGVATQDCTLAIITDDDIGARKAFTDIGADFVEDTGLFIAKVSCAFSFCKLSVTTSNPSLPSCTLN